MPNNIRAILSVIVAVVAVIVFYLEHGSGADVLKWLALVLGAAMIWAVWLFPEGKPKNDQG